MAIQGDTPVVIPEKTLDKYWVTQMEVSNAEPLGAPLLNVTLTPYNDSGDVGIPVKLDPINILQRINEDVTIANTYGMLLYFLENEAKLQGKI